MRFRIIALLLLFVPACSTMQRTTVSNFSEVTGTVKTEIRDEGRIDSKTKKRWLAIIQSLESENSDLRQLLLNRDQTIDEQKSKIEKLNADLSKTSRDAGKADGLGGLAKWILWIIGSALIAIVLFLILRGKIRVPGFIG